MKHKLKLLSLAAFIAALPLLIITDWYYHGYGILVMFLSLTIGLLADQVIRLNFPDAPITPTEHYRKHKLADMLTLFLFMQAPMGLIFGNKAYPNLGLCLLVTMVCLGISIHQIAKRKYPYVIETTEEKL